MLGHCEDHIPSQRNKYKYKYALHSSHSPGTLVQLGILPNTRGFILIVKPEIFSVSAISINAHMLSILSTPPLHWYNWEYCLTLEYLYLLFSLKYDPMFKWTNFYEPKTNHYNNAGKTILLLIQIKNNLVFLHWIMIGHCEGHIIS